MNIKRNNGIRQSATKAIVNAARLLSDTVVEDLFTARMAWDAPRWFLSKLTTKHHGEKVTQEQMGRDDWDYNLLRLILEGRVVSRTIS